MYIGNKFGQLAHYSLCLKLDDRRAFALRHLELAISIQLRITPTHHTTTKDDKLQNCMHKPRHALDQVREFSTSGWYLIHHSLPELTPFTSSTFPVPRIENAKHIL